MSALKRVETATGHHPWVKLVTGAVLLAGMMAPRQTKAQAAPKANPVLAHGDEGCHSNHLRDCSIADLKTLIEKGNDMTKANAAVVLARHGDVTNLPYLLQRLDKEVENGAADPVSAGSEMPSSILQISPARRTPAAP